MPGFKCLVSATFLLLFVVETVNGNVDGNETEVTTCLVNNNSSAGGDSDVNSTNCLAADPITNKTNSNNSDVPNYDLNMDDMKFNSNFGSLNFQNRYAECCYEIQKGNVIQKFSDLLKANQENQEAKNAENNSYEMLMFLYYRGKYNLPLFVPNHASDMFDFDTNAMRFPLKMESSPVFYHEFDETIDLLSLHRDKDLYNKWDRMKYLTGMSRASAEPVSIAKRMLTYEQEIESQKSDSSSVENSTKSTNEVMMFDYIGEKIGTNYLVLKEAISRNRNETVPVVMQSRISLAPLILSVDKGDIILLLTPAHNVSSLYLYPGIHPLRRQSMLDLTFPVNATYNNKNFAPIPLFVKPIIIKQGESIYIPPYWGFRIISKTSVSIIALTNLLKHVIFEEQRVHAAKQLPSLFQQGALSNQPLFFGMWALAVYSDTFFEVEPKTRTSKYPIIFEMAKNRWLVIRNHRGFADDFTDPAEQAEAVSKNIIDECIEMMKHPKDAMIEPSHRARMTNEIVSKAKQNKHTLNLACKATVQVCLEMYFDHIEYAIANSLSAAGTRSFFKCYFNK